MSRWAGARILLLLSVVLPTNIGWASHGIDGPEAAAHLSSQPVEYSGDGTVTYSVWHEGNHGSCTAKASIEKLVLNGDGTYRGRLYQ